MMDVSRRAFFRGRLASESVQKVSLRMPWMVSVERFTDQCTRCAKCIETCPEQIIEKGDGGFPTVNFKKGECTFCSECVEVCEEPIFTSTDATPWDLIAEIAKQPSSSVSLDGTCMAYQGVMCQSCKDVCDTRAIKLNYVTSGMPVPEVENELCTGCGACVSVCPTSAINILSETVQSKGRQSNQRQPAGARA